MAQPNLQPVLDAIAQAQMDFKGDRNIAGIGLGQRDRGGKLEDETVITFFVRRKYANDQQAAAAGTKPIPKVIAGVPTDVIEAHASPHADLAGQRDEIIRDPLIGGVATSNADGHAWLFNSAGTLGMLARDASGNAVALSNWHVWADGGDEGDTIIQPGHPRAEEHLEGVLKVAACGPIVGSLLTGEAPSALTAGLYGAAAAAAIAAAASDEIDPTRRGEDATPVNAGELTVAHSVDMAIAYPDVPWPGTPFTTEVGWRYTRQTNTRVLTHAVTETKTNPHVLLGRRLRLNKTQYEPGEIATLEAAIWDTVQRPCDAYFAVAHLVPKADQRRALRVVLHPGACPSDFPLSPPSPELPGDEFVKDFGEMTPGTQLASPARFDWLSLTNLLGTTIRFIDVFPSPLDGRSEINLGVRGLQLSHAPASRALAEVVPVGTPITLTAFNATGAVLATKMSPASSSSPVTLEVFGPGITRVTVAGLSGLLRKYAVTDVADIPNSHRCCFSGQVQIPPTESPGQWDAYLIVQNVNDVPDGTPPEIAARTIGGHVLTASAELILCSVVLLAEHTFDVI